MRLKPSTSIRAWFLGLGLCLMTSTALAQEPAPPETPPSGPAESPAPTPSPAPSPAAPVFPQAGTPAAGNDEGLYLNAVDTEIREIIKQIAKVTGKNFLIDPKIRGKVTIISEKKMTTEEAYQAFLSALEVLGFTVVTAPGDLIKIIAMKDALQNPLPIYRDESPRTDAFITRLVQMRNISALDMSNAIKGLVSKEGNLFAYPATNTLIITDTGSNIDRLMQIMKELDQEGPSETVEIIPLKFASASDIASKVTLLYDQGATTPSARTGGAVSARRSPRGPELEEAPYLSKVIPDERTNSVIVLASKRAIVKVREIIARLDRKLDEGAEGKIHVHYLKHANAKDLATVLSALTSGIAPASSSTAPGAQPTRGRAPGATGSEVTPIAEFEGGIKVAADENTNALIITATAKDYQTLASEVIDKLDIPRKQVYVEVVIMELTIDKNRSLGISGQIGTGFSLNGNDTLGFVSSLGGTPAGLSAAALSGLAGGIISDRKVTVPITGENGSVSNIEVPAFGAILNALQNDSDVNILSTPNLLTLDNEEAEIVVGAEQPFPTGTTLTPGGNTTFNVNRENVGITLKMTPQINEGDIVKIKLKQEVTQVVDTSAQILTSIGPTTTKRSVDTVVAAKDQQTIVIGGLIDDKVTMSTSKVPFLGDIPILGNLFKQKKTTKAKTNLLVFLRPYIIRDTKDFLKILQKKVEERNMFITQNFGKRQQKVIEQSIRNHAADLLEFKKDIQRVDYDFQNSQGEKLSPAGDQGSVRHQDDLLQAKGSDAK